MKHRDSWLVSGYLARLMQIINPEGDLIIKIEQSL